MLRLSIETPEGVVKFAKKNFAKQIAVRLFLNELLLKYFACSIKCERR